MKSRYTHSSQFGSNQSNKRRALGLRALDGSQAIHEPQVAVNKVRVELSSKVREAQ
jgi:hypothetical protein